MKVSDIEGNQMQVTWDSVDENGASQDLRRRRGA